MGRRHREGGSAEVRAAGTGESVGESAVAEQTAARSRSLEIMPTMKSSHQGMVEGPPQKKYGFRKILIGTDHVVRFKEGTPPKLRQAQFKVRALQKHPDASVKAICLTCRRTYEDIEELRREHLDEHEMVQAMEAHVFGLWSDDAAEADATAKVVAAMVPGIEIQKMPLGLLSDE